MGFAIIGLEQIQCGVNLRIIVRNSSALSARAIFFTGDNTNFGNRYDDTGQYKNIPVFKSKNLLDNIPYGTDIVLVELCDDAENIESFIHPENAFYIFGNETNGLPSEMLKKDFKKIYINSSLSLNLSSSVSIVLYDRNKKINN